MRDQSFRWIAWCRRLPIYVKLPITTVMVLTALCLRSLIVPDSPSDFYFGTFYPVVVLCALMFGTISASAALAESALSADYFFIPPSGFGIEHHYNVVILVIYLTQMAMAIWLIEWLVDLVGRAQRVASTVRVDSELLRELKHRYRNDLQRLITTVEMQARATSVPGVRRALDDVQERIEALASVNQRLDRSIGDNRGGAAVDGAALVRGLIEDWSNTLGFRPVRFSVEADPIILSPSMAANLGLVINEWITNAVKYAFRDDRPGLIAVSLSLHDGIARLVVADNGQGLHSATQPGLGSRIVRGLAAQMGGKAEIVSLPTGLTCTLDFPASN